MASTRSLGLHEPSGVSWLVTEGILSPNPSENEYKWTTSVDETASTGPVDDELVWTSHCVVWSRAGMRDMSSRAARPMEGRAILGAGWLPKTQICGESKASKTNYKILNMEANWGSTLDLKGDQPVAVVDRRPVNEKVSRALVVVLKSQAHIFFVTGTSHTIPLPFEVHSVFATPQGLLFQRKMPDEDPGRQPPTAPPNSFLSSSLFDPRASQSQDFTPLSSKGKRRSSRFSTFQRSSWIPKSTSSNDLPRVFSLIDPHSEMGLVVTSQKKQWKKSSVTSTKPKPSGLDLLDTADEIIYISPKDELAGSGPVSIGLPLILVVTKNTTTGLHTIWTARYRDDDPNGSLKEKARRHTEGTQSKRRSSYYGMTTGTTTPAARPSARESFGPWTENRNASQPIDEKNDPEDDLVSRVAQDFGDVGVPLKTSRRVSSLLARTDLATGQDRLTFSDLATGSQSSTAHPSGLRQSIGAASGRGSFGFNPRASLPPTSGSVYSTAGSFVDAPVDRLLEELNNDVLSEGFENIALRESTSGLPEELLLTRVESFSTKFSGNFRASGSQSQSHHLKVCTLASSDYSSTQKSNTVSVAVCVLDNDSQNLAIVNLRAERVAAAKGGKAKKAKGLEKRPLLVHATGVQHAPNILDACRITDCDISRILTLSMSDNGKRELSLQTPWGSPTKIEIPVPLQLYEPHGISASELVSRPRESGLNRVMADPNLVFEAFDHVCSNGKVDLVDTEQQRHRLQIRMEPRNDLVRRALRVCKFVLRDSEKAGDGLLVAWWEVMKWFRGREDIENDREFTALVIVLFSLAVPFIKKPAPQTPAKRTRRKKGLLRSSSGGYVDLESWENMLDLESGASGVTAPWMAGSAWGWIVEQDAIEDLATRDAVRTPKNDQPNAARSTYRHNTYLTRCITLCREYVQSPQGIRACGSEGYLPISGAFSENTRCTALGSILVGLHLFREEQKLSTGDAEESQHPLGLLAPVIAQLGTWLGWQSWSWNEDAYYGTEMASMERWQFEENHISLLNVPAEPFPPPSIFSFVMGAVRQGSSPFITLLDIVSASDRIPRKGQMWQECFNITPRTLALNGFLTEVHHVSTHLEKLKLLNRWGLTKSIIDTLPEGVGAPLYEAVMQCQIEASTSWSSTLLELIDREDLYMSMNPAQFQSFAFTSPHLVISHDAMRDFHTMSSLALDIDTINFFDPSAEIDRVAIIRQVFRDDRRFMEALRLLNQSKPPVAHCVPQPGWKDSDLLEAQKEITQIVTFRTLSTPAGRAMLSFGGRLPLLTEKLPIPSFSLQCVMSPSNVTVSADKSFFTEEKVCWAFFHNGVSTGLAISKDSKGIDTSWILFNKPQELTNRHAGFLLALGLNGHLKSLAKWVAFKYLTPKHTMTSIGLLLGLSASYLGTMDTLITRLLSVHVTRMLPLGAAELNLSSLTQTAGIMGIGLLYCRSQHRRMSEVMLSEIENTEQDEQSTSNEDLRDEGYRLAAGFALGFINLAKGKDLRGMRDMHIVERLLSIAVGTKNVDFAHVLDRGTAGATVAIAIIFMKTNDAVLAQKIDIPDTPVGFDYVRPDLFLLRTLARHLIMWDGISHTQKWIDESLPQVYRHRSSLEGVSSLRSEDMPLFNIIAGLCFALGLRFAGSGIPFARNILLAYLDQFIRISRLPAQKYDAKLARNSVRNCQDIVALSAAAVCAGRGDIPLFRRLRSLHGRVDPDTPYGSHMAAHMAIGMLFLGGGSHSLGTSDLAVASLLCAFYPIFPTTVLDNKCHLQAFRHLWVLAVEPRCLIPRDIDTRRPISVPINVTFKSSGNPYTYPLLAPYLLPPPEMVSKIEICGPDHWPLVLDFDQNNSLRNKFINGDPSVYLRRKATYTPSGSPASTSTFSSTFTGLSEAQDVLHTTNGNQLRGLPLPPRLSKKELLSGSLSAAATTPSQTPWDWVFNLPSLQGLDIRERSLVLPSSFPNPSPSFSSPLVSSPPWLRTSAVDTRLSLERTIQNVVRSAKGRGADPDQVRDRIWQLRLLFDWLESVEARATADDGDEMSAAQHRSDLWLRRDFIEEAKWLVWGVQVDDDLVET
ncbi:hypothetical protein N7532_001331 [Penicillium argentinense]|uniref:Anaphase-promoting complex subunit 1 n=1 Tax=Penicillium argentinense TaxID=1131581 RepID=A0A9W9G2I1_9EURO|nr:uncharacterized protein N7532_001331 [Penicillium argentinense]KAJ5110796.1 hypothetical protein N7532_001331 [Penicillium argentinense]